MYIPLFAYLHTCFASTCYLEFLSLFLTFYVSLLIFPFCSYIIFFTFSTSSPSSLRIFKTVWNWFFSSRSVICSFSVIDSLDLFFPLNGPYFPVYLNVLWIFVFVVVVVANWTFESDHVVTLGIKSSSFPRTCCFCLLSAIKLRAQELMLSNSGA